MATVITRYVNGASSNGGDGTTQLTSGANRAFATVTAAHSAMFTAYPNLVTADVQIDIVIDGTSSVGGGFTFSAFTVDATRYLRLTTNSTAKHSGFYTSSLAKMTDSSGGFFLAIPNFTRWEGVVFEETNVSGYATILQGTSGFDGWVFDSCIFHKTNSSVNASSPAGFQFAGVNKKAGRWSNNIFSGKWSRCLNFNYGDITSAIVIYNNTMVGVEAGIDLGNMTNNKVRMYNNVVELYSGSAGACYTGTGIQSTLTNISSDATSPQSGLRNRTATYVDSLNFDLRLDPSDTVAQDAGTNLSADSIYPFAVDMLGNPRSAPWDVGAFEVQGGGSPTYSNVFDAMWIQF